MMLITLWAAFSHPDTAALLYATILHSPLQ